MAERFRELTPKEERPWINVMMVASPDIAENEERLMEAQEILIIGQAMAMGWC